MPLAGKLAGQWLVYPHDHRAFVIVGSASGSAAGTAVPLQDGKGAAVEGDMIGKGALTGDKDVITSETAIK